MSAIKNPIILAVIASAVVFITMCYFKNKKNDDEKDIDDETSYDNKKGRKNGKRRRNNNKYEENTENEKKSSYETQIIVAVIVGIVTWWIASTYFNKTNDSNKLNKLEAITVGGFQGSDNRKLQPGLPKSTDTNASIQGYTNQQKIKPSKLVSNNSTGIQKGGSVKMLKNSKIPRISSDDPTRSYNLIGSGLNIPRSELNIPSVLIDYN